MWCNFGPLCPPRHFSQASGRRAQVVECEDECGEIDTRTLERLLQLGHACENASQFEVALEVCCVLLSAPVVPLGRAVAATVSAREIFTGHGDRCCERRVICVESGCFLYDNSLFLPTHESLIFRRCQVHFALKDAYADLDEPESFASELTSCGEISRKLKRSALRAPRLAMSTQHRHLPSSTPFYCGSSTPMLCAWHASTTFLGVPEL